MSAPSLEGRIVILSDPMMATGASLVKTVDRIQTEGTPAAIHIVTAIAAVTGIELVQREVGADVQIWCGDIDEELTAKGYIVPGLGDAGDLAYGSKNQF
jgi:uracil phosphoribosyltransferase